MLLLSFQLDNFQQCGTSEENDIHYFLNARCLFTIFGLGSYSKTHALLHTFACWNVKKWYVCFIIRFRNDSVATIIKKFKGLIADSSTLFFDAQLNYVNPVAHNFFIYNSWRIILTNMNNNDCGSNFKFFLYHFEGMAIIIY